MHVLVPTGIFHPEAGGPATYLHHFLPELLARGHTASVITFSDDPGGEYSYPVTRIPRTNIIQRNLAYYRAVRKALPAADVVFVNSLGIPLPTIKQPTVLKIVGDRAWERAINRGWISPYEDIDDFQKKDYGRLVNWIKHSRSREAQRADKVIVPSDYLRGMVMGWGVPDERIHVIYNAFEAVASGDERPSRSELDLPEGPLLLVAARLTAWKGVDALIHALADLPDIHLVVAGTGPTFKHLQMLAAKLGDQVRFLGNVPHDDLHRYYAVADYTVLYSGYEGLSHVILESLNAGTPVIASDKCGNPEVITDGENGLLVPYKDVDALKSALERAFSGDTPQRLRKAARIDPNRFAWANLVEQTISLLENPL
jgi:glycosyltransferase involved in cell wall biosynthesis